MDGEFSELDLDKIRDNDVKDFKIDYQGGQNESLNLTKVIEEEQNEKELLRLLYLLQENMLLSSKNFPMQIREFLWKAWDPMPEDILDILSRIGEQLDRMMVLAYRPSRIYLDNLKVPLSAYILDMLF